jgi:pimeloyl-ACP methyl ester carboxylesterase
VVAQAGHSAYFEKPEEVNRLILDVIARRAGY